ncbi:hypothetical protein, conserved in T. vivax, partial [Trypanosoma vivax Y486]
SPPTRPLTLAVRKSNASPPSTSAAAFQTSSSESDDTLAAGPTHDRAASLVSSGADDAATSSIKPATTVASSRAARATPCASLDAFAATAAAAAPSAVLSCSAALATDTFTRDHRVAVLTPTPRSCSASAHTVLTASAVIPAPSCEAPSSPASACSCVPSSCASSSAAGAPSLLELRFALLSSGLPPSSSTSLLPAPLLVLFSSSCGSATPVVLSLSGLLLFGGDASGSVSGLLLLLVSLSPYATAHAQHSAAASRYVARAVIIYQLVS